MISDPDAPELRSVRREDLPPAAPTENTANMPVVQYVPVRCPRCRRGTRRHETYGWRLMEIEGRVVRWRWHKCADCRISYLSQEEDPERW